MIHKQVLAAIEEIVGMGAKTPFYYFDIDSAVKALASIEEGFRSYFNNFILAYSYKTNSISELTKLIASLGHSAEVVSGAELFLSLKDGFSPDRIVFDGPVKDTDELTYALKMGVRVQLDSLAETASLIEIKKEFGLSPVVSLRVAPKIRRRISRFGFTEDELFKADAMLREAGITWSGMHFNLGAHQMSPKAYALVINDWRKVISLLVNTTRPAGRATIDIGGGFPALSAEPSAKILPWTAYARTISQSLHDIGVSISDIQLIIEPGRAIIEDSGFVVLGVHSSKVRKNRKLLVLDGGSNLVKSRSSWFHPVVLVPTGSYEYDLYGSMCFENDLIARKAKGPKIIDDNQLVIVGSAGGYDVPSASGWIRPLPHVWTKINDSIHFAGSGYELFNEARIAETISGNHYFLDGVVEYGQD